MSDELKDSFTEAALLKVIERIQLHHGDILVIDAPDDETMQQFASMLNEFLDEDIKVLLVKQGNIEFVAEIDEEFMATLGWYRKESSVKLIMDVENEDINEDVIEVEKKPSTSGWKTPELAKKIKHVEYRGLSNPNVIDIEDENDE